MLLLRALRVGDVNRVACGARMRRHATGLQAAFLFPKATASSDAFTRRFAAVYLRKMSTHAGVHRDHLRHHKSISRETPGH
jgi:hypothetical protein